MSDKRESCIIGIDIGTTTVSFSVLDTLSHRQTESYNVLNRAGCGLAEYTQDADAIYAAVLEQVEELTQRFDVKAIGITGQMHGVVLIDGDLNAVSPLYTWENRTGLPYIDEIEEKTGTRICPGYGFATLYGLMKNGDIPGKTYSFCSIMDYVLLKLCANKKVLVHSSVAASLGLFDVGAGCFRKDLVKKLGLDGLVLPEVTSKSIFAGTYKNIPVAVAIGDNQASFLGSVPETGKSVLVNFGTGSQISVVVDDYRGRRCQEPRPYIDGKYLLTGCALCGGKAYSVLEKFFRLCKGTDECQYDFMNTLALESEDSPLCVDTRFCGTRSCSTQKGSVSGIDEQNFTPAALVKGFLYGMAGELYTMLAEMGIGEFDTLVASGNGVRKNLALQKILSERFGKEAVLPYANEEAAHGASLFAANALAGRKA